MCFLGEWPKAIYLEKGKVFFADNFSFLVILVFLITFFLGKDYDNLQMYLIILLGLN
jgi:hypothetical protein